MGFTEESTMPFGKFAGRKIANVPAEYLIWLNDQSKNFAPNKKTLFQKYLKDYVEKNKEALELKIKENK